MKRLWALLLAALLLAGNLPGAPARAETPETSIAVSGDQVLPGQSVIVSLNVPEDGTCNIDLLDSDGNLLARVAEASAGTDVLAFVGLRRARGA